MEGAFLKDDLPTKPVLWLQHTRVNATLWPLNDAPDVLPLVGKVGPAGKTSVTAKLLPECVDRSDLCIGYCDTILRRCTGPTRARLEPWPDAGGLVGMHYCPVTA